MKKTESRADDADLVRRALDGDRSAVGEIYDRYANHIFSFCRSRLRNDADAADAMQDTFVRASTRLDQLRNPAKLRSWLFAIARNQIVASGRVTARATGGDGMELLASEDDELDADLLRVEAAAQLWDASAGLSERDQEVLELHVRHGLGGSELADALGVSESHSYVLLSRVRDRIASSLGGLLVARLGRDDCDELDQLLTSWDGRFTIDVRSKVTRHVRSCEVCEQTHTTVLASGVSFGVVPLLAVPGGLRTQTVDKMVTAIDVSKVATGSTGTDATTITVAADVPLDATTPWEWKPDGFPTPIGAGARHAPAWLKMAAAIAAVVMLVGVGGWLRNQSDSETDLATGDDVEIQEPEVLSEAAAPPPPLESSTSTTTETATSTTEQVPEQQDGNVLVVTADGVEAEPASSSTIPETTAPETTTTEAEPELVIDPEDEEDETDPADGADGQDDDLVDEEDERREDRDEQDRGDEAGEAEEEEEVEDEDEGDEDEDEDEGDDDADEQDPPEPANLPPVIEQVLPRTDAVQAQRAGACDGEMLGVSIEVSDPDGEVVSVELAWQPTADSTTTTAATSRQPPIWFGQIGAWLTPGTKSIQVIATDDAGAATATMFNVDVTACPFGFSG